MEERELKKRERVGEMKEREREREVEREGRVEGRERDEKERIERMK